MAPFTGGASLAWMPALTGLGSGVGSFTEGDTQAGLEGVGQGAFSGHEFYDGGSGFTPSFRPMP
jgi:hypothetical protein